MRKIWIIFFCFLATCCTAGAQSLDLFNIDASGFPTIKAKFYAFDKEGKQISDLSPSDFTLAENETTRKINKVSCPPPVINFEKVSVAMSIDISGSMASGTGTTDIPVELGKITASNIARSFSLPPHEMALQTCHSKAFINLDFTSNRQRILETIAPVSAGGDNDFVEHLLNAETGILNVAKKGKYNRAAILYTDAWWYALSADELQRCKDTCFKYNIRFFVAIYSRPEAEPNGIKKSLRELADATGGRLYDGIISTEEAEALANELKSAVVAGSSEPCEIEWISDGECSTTFRNVQLSLPEYNVIAENNYSAPNSSIISIDVQPSDAIRLRDVKPGDFKDTSITITPNNSSVEILNITASHSTVTVIDYGGSPPPFLLQDGEKRTIRVRFSPLDSSKVFVKLIIENNKCKPVYGYISGGIGGKKSVSDQLKIIHPNGSEVFVVGSDTMIVWDGVPPSDTVALDYSTDNGVNWTEITQKATGLQHRWHIPNSVSTQCLVRVRSYNADDKDWVHTGHSDPEVSNIISGATDEDGFTYVFGLLNRSDLDFGNSLKLIKAGLSDLYIAKYSPEGRVVWAKNIVSGAITENWSAALKIDYNGNIYIAGHFRSTLDFGNGVSLSQSVVNDLNFDSYVAKFDNDGNALWAKSLHGTPQGATSRDLATCMTIDNDGFIYVGGYFDSAVLEISNTIKLSNSGDEDGFISKFTPDGDALWAKSISGTSTFRLLTERIYSLHCDDDNNIYATGLFISDVLQLGKGVSISHSDGEYFNENGFIIKYDENGEVIWGKKAGESKNNILGKLTTDESGSIYLTGIFSDGTTMDFGKGYVLSKGVDAEARFLAKYDRDCNIQWAQLSPPISRMMPDADNNLLVCGSFTYSAKFSNALTLKGEGSYDTGFLAQYNTDGDVLWAKKIGGTGRTYVSSLSKDGMGNIYVGGQHAGSFLDFSNGISIADLQGIFVAKYSLSRNVDQSDMSDAVFSIVKPLAASHNIDMGRVLVTSSKDSLIQSFIENTGSWPIRIDAINIAGANATDFQLVSGIPPFTIPVGDKKAVEFRFRPSAIGPRSADLAIITQADTLHQTIIGEGVKPVIQVASSFIDFGLMEVGSLKDTTATAVLKNIGDVPLSITNTHMLGPDKEQFEILSGGGSFTLASGATQIMQLRFAPKYIGRTSGQIGFDYDGMAGGRPAVVQLFGQGIGGNVSVVDDSAYVGETRGIQLMLGKVKPASIAQTAATSFRVKLAFNNSILTPTREILLKSTAFKKGVDTDTLTITQEWNAQSSELAQIPFVATLGDRLSTEMELLEFDWLDDSGSKIDYDTELQSGVFTVLGICPEGGDRLFDADGEAQMMLVTPNPVNSSAEVRFKTIEKGNTTITLTDVLGRQIELARGDYSTGEHSVEIPAEKLTQGIYFLTMQTPTQAFTQRVVVEK